MEQSNSWQWQLFPGLLSCKLTWKTGAVIHTIRLIMKLECAGMHAAGSRQSMETGHWKSCCRIGQCGSMIILWIWYLLIAFARTWIYDGLLTCYPGFQIRDSFLAALDFSLPLFAACSGFWLVHLGNMSDLVQLFKSGHFSLDLYMLCKLFRIR